MSGEVIATNTGFNKNSSSSFAVGSSAYTYVQRFGRGNKGRMYGSPRSNIFTDDSFVMRVYYYSGGWVQSNAMACTVDGNGYSLNCTSTDSYRTRWYFLWDARPYGDGKAYFSGYGQVFTAYSISHSSYPKGKHLKMYRLTNFGVSTSNTAATSSSTTKITTAHYVCTKYQ